MPESSLEKFEEKIPGTLVKFTMVKVPGKDFFIGETEVTWDVYDVFAFRLDLTAEQEAAGVDAECRPSKPYGSPDKGFGHAGYPALGVHSNAAIEFCKWLSSKTGKKYRLPTVEEWELAARAGADKEPSIEDHAWYWENADDIAHPVAKKKPNAWGIYDMLGNVAEWAIGKDGEPVACGGHYMDKSPSFAWRKPYDPRWQESDPQFPKSNWWLADAPFNGLRVVCER